MNVYATDKIRDVVILGHGSAGKTSLVEAMAYLSGLTNRLGNITDGNTISDYDKEEQKRKFSINTSLVPIIWNDYKINILDTPGYFDFVGEVEEAVAAAGAAIIVVNGKNGVEVGTLKAWEMCDRYDLPRMIFISNMDVDNASYEKTLSQLKELYGKKIAPLFLPVRENGKYVGYVNVVKKRARKFVDKQKKVEIPIPDELMDTYRQCRTDLLDSVAESSEELMDRYFSSEDPDNEFTMEETYTALKNSARAGELVPVAIGSSVNLQGVMILLDDILNYFPAPNERTITGTNVRTGEPFQADYDVSKPKSAFIFKSIADPFIGKYSMIKVASGSISGSDTLYDAQSDTEFRVGKVYSMAGNKPIEVEKLNAGDIGALAKLDAETGDTLSTKADPVRYDNLIEFSTPYTYKAFTAKKKGEDDKVAQALMKIGFEDRTIRVVNDAENRQTLLYGIGDQQLDVVASKVENVYKVGMNLEEPKIAFRETIRRNSDVDSKYKKQSGGHGQYGHVKMRFEPSGDTETPYVFEQVVVGGAVPKNYFPAVEKGVAESCQRGPLAGYPVVGVKATLYDGSYHPVDSSEMAFKTASSMAFKKGFMEADPILLEPIVDMKVVVPDKYTGDVMGDLNKRRGRVLGMNPDHHGNTIVEAEVPQAEIYGYSTQLRSMTGGAGDFSYEFVRYEQAPADVQKREVEARAAETAE